MVKTIRKLIEGLLWFWKHGKLTRTSQEGFNSVQSVKKFYTLPNQKNVRFLLEEMRFFGQLYGYLQIACVGILYSFGYFLNYVHWRECLGNFCNTL